MKEQKILNLIAVLAVVFQAAVSAQTPAQLTTLLSFGGTNGASPAAPLLLASDGNFYGTTMFGGSYADPGNYGYGTIFKMTLNGALTTLVMFDGENGWNPYAGLVADAQSNFYGTTTYGGTNIFFDQDAGNIFKLATDGTLSSLISFDYTNGAWPSAPLAVGPDGNLYGTAGVGGIYPGIKGDGGGTVFRISPAGDFAKLFDFDGTNGTGTYAAFTPGSDGNLYCPAGGGGTNGGFGMLYRLTTNGTLTSLFSFNGSNGACPTSTLRPGRNGSMYGTTELGGLATTPGFGSIGESGYTNTVFGNGTVFRLDIDGTLTTLVYFDGTNGSHPVGDLLLGADGNFYGVTIGAYGGPNKGTVFQLSPDGTFKNLVYFNGTNGASPRAGLVAGPDGNLYGTTASGGANGLGTVYRLTVPMTPVLQSVSANSSQFVFSWNSVAGLNYQVQSNPDPGSTNWANVGPVLTASAGTTFQTNSVASSQGFYRVLLVQ